jgi:hypothetical protein
MCVIDVSEHIIDDIEAHGSWLDRAADCPQRRFHFSSGRLSDADIPSNAVGDIVEIRSALIQIRDKLIRFQHEMHKHRRLSHELATG